MDESTISVSSNTTPCCPIDHAMLLFGDRWSLLLIRDMLFGGKRRYKEFLASPEGISTNILANRLKQLQQYALVQKFPDPCDGKASIYIPTGEGIALAPVLTELIRWGMANKQQCVIPDAISTALADPNYDFTAGLLTAIAAERSALIQS